MQIRPRTNVELLDAAFALGRQLMPRLLLVAAVSTAATVLASLMSSAMKFPWIFFSPLIFVLTSDLPTWLLEAAAIEHVMNGKLDWAAARTRFGRVWLRLLLTHLGFLALTALAGLLFLFPAVIVYLGRFFYSEVLLAEGPEVRSAFARSQALTRGGRDRLGWLLLGWSLLSGSQYLYTGLLARHSFPGVVIEVALGSVLLVVRAMLNLLAYFDRRARIEGFDLLERSERLRAPTTAAVA